MLGHVRLHCLDDHGLREELVADLVRKVGACLLVVLHLSGLDRRLLLLCLQLGILQSRLQLGILQRQLCLLGPLLYFLGPQLGVLQLQLGVLCQQLHGVQSLLELRKRLRSQQCWRAGWPSTRAATGLSAAASR